MKQLINVISRTRVKGNEKPTLTRVYCNLPDGQRCPLKERNSCLQTYIGRGCEHKNFELEYGPTRRARTFGKWTFDADEASNALKVQFETVYPAGMVQIGEMVYMPYAFINEIGVNKHVGVDLFSTENNFFVTGSKFISIDNFTPEVFDKLASFRPIALMGHELTEYQKKSLPAMLADLKACRFDVWEALSEAARQKTGGGECKVAQFWHSGKSQNEIGLERARARLWGNHS